MPHALYDGELRARDGGGYRLAHRGRTRVVVFAGEQRDLAAIGVDAPDVLAAVPVVAVEMHVALVYARARLAVVPPVLAPARLRTVGRVEPVGVTRGELAAVDRRVMEELVVAAGRVGAAFEPDNAGQLLLIIGGELEHDGAAHRAAYHHRSLEPEREPHRADHGDIGGGGEAIFLEPPAVGRCRAAVIGQVEGDDAKAPDELAVVEQMAVLPAVGAGRVQAEKGQAGAGLLDEDAVGGGLDVDGKIAARNRLELRHRAPPSRASRSSSGAARVRSAWRSGHRPPVQIRARASS